MESTKIYKVLSGLSVPMLNSFQKFVRSPFFNVNEELTQFAVELVDLVKQNKSIDKIDFYKNLTGSDKFDDQKFRTSATKVLQLTEKFISQEQFEQDTLLYDQFLLQGIRQHKLKVLDKKATSNAKRNLDRSLESSSNYYLQKYLFELNFYKRVNEFEKKSLGGDPLENSNIFEINPPLDQFYVISKLRYINELITYNYMYKLNIDLGDFKMVEQIILDKNLTDYIPIQTYYLLCKTLMNPDDEIHYPELKNLISNHLDYFTDIEKRELFNSIFNFTISKVNKGEKQFYEDILEIYDLGIEKEIILIEGKLSVTSFRNIAVTAMRLNRNEYARELIEKNASLLKEEDRESAVSFSLARIAMNEKDWRKAIEYISVIDFEDSNYNLTSRLMMLNAYYELKEFGPLESLMDSFTVFLRRKKFVNESIKLGYLSHLKFLRKMIKLFNPSKKKLEEIKTEINNTKQVFNKAWLIEKIEEFS